MILNSTHSNMLISPARSVAGMVELYDGSTLLNTFKHTDALSSFTVSRAGDKKFFGFGVCQEIEVKLVDRERAINITESQILKASFVVNNSTVSPTPLFYVSEVARDENTNEITIKAYDIIHKAKSYTVAELGLVAPYTILDVVNKIVEKLGIFYNIDMTTRDALNIEYPEGANFDGSETLREVLDDIAEATQTIYFINNTNRLTFKDLKANSEPVLTINKADYFTLESKTNRILSDICSATELGDNITTTSGLEGITQYVRDNPFWELREDINTLLDNAISVIGGITLNQFNCKWRGNYLVEPGDKIAIVAKDDTTVISYLLDEKYIYNGGFSAETMWEYGEKNGETASNPTSLGDALKQTFAKVDKANKQVEIMVSDVEANKEEISRLEMTTTSISGTVATLENRVNATITAEDVKLEVQKQIEENPANEVKTTTGFTFNSDGLTVEKSGSEMTTQITEDGMKIYRNDQETLTVNNVGVNAANLHATTYLIVGDNSRFENYGSNRTGCFWIGEVR